MAAQGALRVLEHHLAVHRQFWRGGLVLSLFAPLMYLAALGVGLGSLIGSGARQAGLGGLSYLDFVGPGLLAASTMQVASTESMWPIMGGLKWWRTWHAMLATPLQVRDLVAGQFLYTMARLGIGATAYLVALLVFGVVASPMAVLAVPAAVLCGMAFATPIAAFSATQDNEQGFLVVFRLGVLPLFLFSGTFFPVDQLPGWLEPVARVTPLWHGVELARSLVLGSAAAGDALHALYLAVWVAAGWVAARRTFRRRLVQ